MLPLGVLLLPVLLGPARPAAAAGPVPVTETRAAEAGAGALAPAVREAAVRASVVRASVLRAPVAGGTASCTTPDVALGFALLYGMSGALRGRTPTVAVQVDDPSHGTHCELRADRHFDSASVVKVTVLGALLMAAEKQGRELTAREESLARAMITRSDNEATSALWQSLGLRRIDAFRKAAGMTGTVLGKGGYWGLTRITARDQNTLLGVLTAPGPVLTHASRSRALGLMGAVVDGQRWGIPAGAPAGLEVRLKNGWLPRAGQGWRVNSSGVFTTGRCTYRLTVLTEGGAAMGDGIAAVEAVSRAVHRSLAGVDRGAC
ncbi:serine hydrolase [Streptomyces sp. NPDC003691]